MVRMRVRVTAASPITIHTTVLPRLTVASLQCWINRYLDIQIDIQTTVLPHETYSCQLLCYLGSNTK